MSDPHAPASKSEAEKPGSAGKSDKDKDKDKEKKAAPSLVEQCAELPPPSEPQERKDWDDQLRKDCRDLEKRRREASGFQTEVMSFHLGRWGIIGLVVYTLLFGCATTYSLMKVWPADSISTAASRPEPEPESKAPASTTTAAPGRQPAAAPATPTAPATPAAPTATVAPAAGTAAPAGLGDTAKPATCKPTEACADTVIAFRIEGLVPGVTFDFRPPHASRRFLYMALFAGGLGAFLSSLLSLATYIGERELTRSWIVWYLARPPLGMGLALLVYFLLRGGLLAPEASVSVVSPYGVAAFSGLIGMFVRQAMDKLAHIAETIFPSPIKRSESVQPTPSSPPGSTATGDAGSAPPKPSAGPSGTPAAPVAPEVIAAAHVQDPGA